MAMTWPELTEWLYRQDPREGITGQVVVEVTEQHIALIRRYWATWSWVDWRPKDAELRFCGAPFIGTYRPYGNSDVMGDIAEICGIKQPDWEAGEDWTDDQMKELALLHRGAGFALEIMLQHGQLQPGHYTSISWMHDWQPVKES